MTFPQRRAKNTDALGGIALAKDGYQIGDDGHLSGVVVTLGGEI